MSVTVQQVVTATITELSQIPGTSTQIYGTPRIQQYVQDAFDFCFQAAWWLAYTSYSTNTLDGTTGRLTADIDVSSGFPSTSVKITQFTNIRQVFAGDTSRVLRSLPRGINPAVITGSEPMFVAPDTVNVNAPIRFYPITAAGTVTLECRQEPLHPFALTDVLYFDGLMLSLGAAYMYAADDGTNPGQINKFQSMFMKRLKDMLAAESDTKIQLDPRLPTTWDSSTVDIFTVGSSPLG